jgi:outer membrane protein assembly factor BamB
MFRCFLTLVGLVCCGALVQADNWPAWRGPTGQGYTTEQNLPLKWSTKENVKWKVAMPYLCNSTPVIWGDKIFLTQSNKGGTTRGLMCLARADGQLLWHQKVEYPDKERNWTQDWYCNASPVTDGERVVACFASAGLYCFDLKGKELWKRTDLGKWEHMFGNGSSPILYGDLLIQWCGPNEGKGRNFLLAVNKKTGETVWEHDEKFGSWSTPLISRVGDQDQLLLGMSLDVKNAPDEKTGFLKGFDPKSGKELWSCHGLNSYVYASPLVRDGIAVAMSGYGGAGLAVKLGGSGDITKDRLWHHPRNIQRVGTGAIVGDHVYMLEENCTPHCYELKTGKEVWEVEKRPGGSTWSSMVVSGDRLYVLTQQGTTYVFAARPKYELLATNRLDEPTNCSIAVSDGELFIRTARNLWCISEKK